MLQHALSRVLHKASLKQRGYDGVSRSSSLPHPDLASSSTAPLSRMVVMQYWRKSFRCVDGVSRTAIFRVVFAFCSVAAICCRIN
jgi:hypothetical protein